MTPVEYASGKHSLRAYIAVCLHIHCNPSSLLCVHACFTMLSSAYAMATCPLVYCFWNGWTNLSSSQHSL